MRPYHILVPALIALFIWAPPASAEKTDPSMIPPDVTLPVGNTGSTTSAGATASSGTAPQPDTPAPGMSGASSAPGQIGAPGTAYAGSQAGGGAPGGPQPPPVGSGPSPAGKHGQPPNAAAGAPAGQNDQRPDPIAQIETNKGVITIRLFRQFAPRTVAQFIELCQKGFYNGLTFHRVEPGFVIQGGCPQGNGSGLYMDGNKPKMIPLEPSPQLRHNSPGVVAMARFPKNPNSSSCQFYITLAPQSKLDGQYSIFGGVISGLDVVRNIAIGDKMLTVSVREQ